MATSVPDRLRNLAAQMASICAGLTTIAEGLTAVADDIEQQATGLPALNVAGAVDAFLLAHDPDAVDPADRGWLPDRPAEVFVHIALAGSAYGLRVAGFPSDAPDITQPTEADLIAVLDIGLANFTQAPAPAYSPAQRAAFLAAFGMGS